MLRRLWWVTATVVLAACTSGSSSAGSTPSATRGRKPSTTTLSLPAGSFAVSALGIRFQLPESFTQDANPDFGFLARSETPRAVFSVDPDDPSVIDHGARPGESLTSVTVGGHGAVVVTRAAVEGLPPGIEARELLVDNGDRSFSVVLSAEVAELPQLWDAFFASLAFGAA